MHICICIIYVNTCIHLYTKKNIHVYIHIYCAHKYVFIHMCSVQMHAKKLIYAHMRFYARTHVHTYTDISVNDKINI